MFYYMHNDNNYEPERVLDSKKEYIALKMFYNVNHEVIKK